MLPVPSHSSMLRHRGWTTPVSALRSAPTVPSAVPLDGPSDPTLLHRRAARADLFGAAVPTDAAAEDGEQEEAADTGGDADDDGAMFLEKVADFFGGGRAFALALCKNSQYRSHTSVKTSGRRREI